MTYDTNSINSATPGPAFYAVIEAIMLAQGWTLDDTVVIGARTHKVLKSASAGNARGLDWWLDISYTTTGAGSIMMAPFESYIAGSDLGVRGPYSVSDTGFDPTTYTRFGATGSALETSWANSVNHTGLQVPLVAGSAFIYYLSVSRNRVAFFLSNDTNLLYCGFWLPSAQHIAQAGASLFPLIVTRMASGVNSNSSTSQTIITAAVTRLPKFPDLSATYITSGWGGSVFVFFNPGMISGIGGQQVHPATGELAMSPMCVGLGQSSANTLLGYVGQLDGVVQGYVNVTAGRGDTMVQGVDTYVMQARSTNNAIFLKAA